MMGPMCVVVAHNEETRNTMATLLHDLGAQSTLLASLGELRTTFLSTPTSGILLELATAVRASPDEKEITQELLDFYPSAKFRLVGTNVFIPGKSLAVFVDECRKFTPRVIRSEVRKTRYLAILVSSDASFKAAERSITINVSDGGCFAFSTRPWEVGQRLWIRDPERDTTVTGTVCGSQPWGNNRLLPGINVKLDEEWHGFFGASTP